MYRHTLYKIIALVIFITTIICIGILGGISQYNRNINEGLLTEHTHGSHNDDFQYEHTHRMHGPHNHP